MPKICYIEKRFSVEHLRLIDIVNSQLLYARLQAAPYLQRQLPGYSTCKRCEFPVLLVRMHSTSYEWADQRVIKEAFIKSTGVGGSYYWSKDGGTPRDMPDYFPSKSVNALCEDCWSELRAPDNRLPYYMLLVDEWERESPATDYSQKREQIRRGVLTEGQPPTEITGSPWLLESLPEEPAE